MSKISKKSRKSTSYTPSAISTSALSTTSKRSEVSRKSIRSEISSRINTFGEQVEVFNPESNITLNIAKTNQQQVNLHVGLGLFSRHETKICLFMPEISVDYSYPILNKGYKVKITNNLDNRIMLLQKIINDQDVIKIKASLNIIANRIELSSNYEYFIQNNNTKMHISTLKFKLYF